MRYIFLLFFILFGITTFSQQPFRLTAQTEKVTLMGGTKLYVDKSGKTQISEIIEAEQNQIVFQDNHNLWNNLGRGNGFQWLKLNFTSEVNKEFFLEIDYPFIDSLQCFLVKNSPSAKPEIIKSWKTTWRQPSIKREVAYRNFVFKLPLEANTSYQYYIRAYNRYNVLQVPLKIWSEQRLSEWMENETLAWGGLYGCLFFASVISFFFFLFLQERTYLYYALYVFSLMLTQMTLEGFLNQIFPNGPSLLTGVESKGFFTILSVTLNLQFTRSFLNFTKEKHPFLYYATNIITLVAFLILLPTFAFGSSIETMLFLIKYFYTIPLMGSILLLFVMLFISAKSGYRPAWLYIIGITPLMLVATLSTLTKLLPPDLWFLTDASSVFEVAVLGIGLAIRFKKIQVEQQQLYIKLSEEQRKNYEAQLGIERQESLRSAEEIKYLSAMNEGRVEKERIARDLHDNIGSQIAYMISSLDFVARKSTETDTPKLQNQLETIAGSARETMQTLRETLWVINQENISVNTFVEKVQVLVNQYFQLEETTEFFVKVEGDTAHILKTGQALNLFRITQEAINNAIKYAEAKQIEILIKVTKEHINLSISDNGVGFDKNIKHTGRYGLKNMQKRTQTLQGKFLLKTAKDSGTEVSVQIPL
jgi:two-component system, sensor histidine kinase LadS